jgi:hypothetical protein
MKNVAIFLHGNFNHDFFNGGVIHKIYQQEGKRRINWNLITGSLDLKDSRVKDTLKMLSTAEIFICDSDNNNIFSEDQQNFDEKLKKFLSRLKEINPSIKIFIKIFTYTGKKEIKTLKKFGEIIENWVDNKVITEIKK